MGLEPERAQPEPGGVRAGVQAGARLRCCPLQPPHSCEPLFWGSPRLGGLPLQFAASCRGFQLQGSPRAPQEITAPKCAPPAGRRGGCVCPGSRTPSVRGLGPPKQVSSPSVDSEGSRWGREAQPGREPGTALPQRRTRQYDSKSYFTVAKERHVSRESPRGSTAGSRCAGQGSRLCTAHPGPAAAPPLAGTPILHPSTDHPPTYGSLLAQSPGRGQRPHPEPSAGSRARSPIPKASSRAKQEKLMLFFLPLTPRAPAPLPWSRRHQRGMCPLSPQPWLKSDPAQEYIL